MTLRPCLECPKLVRRPRCAAHQQAYERRRGTSAARGYDAEHRRLRLEAINAQPWCSRCFAVTDDLVADHVVPLVRGGASTLDNLQVLCKPCNTAKGGR